MNNKKSIDEILNEEYEIRNTIDKDIMLYNAEYPDHQIDNNNVYINKLVDQPGAVGCYHKDNNWFVYHIDDRHEIFVKGPFSKDGVIHVLASKLYIPSTVANHYISEDELRISLAGMKPIEKFEQFHK